MQITVTLAVAVAVALGLVCIAGAVPPYLGLPQVQSPSANGQFYERQLQYGGLSQYDSQHYGAQGGNPAYPMYSFAYMQPHTLTTLSQDIADLTAIPNMLACDMVTHKYLKNDREFTAFVHIINSPECTALRHNIMMLPKVRAFNVMYNSVTMAEGPPEPRECEVPFTLFNENQYDTHVAGLTGFTNEFLGCSNWPLMAQTISMKKMTSIAFKQFWDSGMAAITETILYLKSPRAAHVVQQFSANGIDINVPIQKLCFILGIPIPQPPPPPPTTTPTTTTTTTTTTTPSPSPSPSPTAASTTTTTEAPRILSVVRNIEPELADPKAPTGGDPIVPSPEVPADVAAAEGAPIVPSPEVPADVAAAEGAPIVPGPEVPADVAAAEGAPIVPGPEVPADVAIPDIQAPKLPVDPAPVADAPIVDPQVAGSGKA